jgi:hypothetical protein
MKHLLPTTDEQTINIIPRLYTIEIVMYLRDDSTNDEVNVILPNANITSNYLQISNVFNLKEGHFYDLKIYYVHKYSNFKQRVIADSGNFENNTCLFTFLQAQELLEKNQLSIIYRDKIFCTSQSTDQSKKEHYSVNKNEYKSQNGNNDFIIL